MDKSDSLQNKFLTVLTRESVIVTINLTTGFQFRGTVISFDDYTILMESEEKPCLVYKAAVASIVPSKNISLKKYDTCKDFSKNER